MKYLIYDPYINLFAIIFYCCFCIGNKVLHAYLNTSPALVLNADYRPLSYFPLSLWAWQDAVKAVFLNRVFIVSQYDHIIRSPSSEFKLPSVIALKKYISLDRRPAFTRFNVFLRDSFCCQYCNNRFDVENLTFDHVVPRSRGGCTAWNNVVTACNICNLKKGDSLPSECSMSPRNVPIHPSTGQLQTLGRLFPPQYLHESWRDYLYWDTELDSEKNI